MLTKSMAAVRENVGCLLLGFICPSSLQICLRDLISCSSSASHKAILAILPVASGLQKFSQGISNKSASRNWIPDLDTSQEPQTGSTYSPGFKPADEQPCSIAGPGIVPVPARKRKMLINNNVFLMFPLGL